MSPGDIQPRPVNISSPPVWSISKTALHDAMAAWQVVAADSGDMVLRDRRGPFALPAYYDDYCRRRFIAWRQTHPSTLWTDVEPIFALAAVTLPSSESGAIAERRIILESEFARLRGSSPLEWGDAEKMILQAWAALDGLD